MLKHCRYETKYSSSWNRYLFIFSGRTRKAYIELIRVISILLNDRVPSHV